VIENPRLSWVDAMWIDSDGKLWLPAAQLHLTSTFQGGRDKVHPPIQVFSLRVDVQPPGNDHA